MAAVAEHAEARASVFRMAWLFGPRADFVAFVVPFVLALVLLAVGRALGLKSTPSWGFLVCVVMVDVAHVHSTAFRVYLDKTEVMRRPWLYLGTPLLVYVLGATLHHLGGALLFWRVLAYVAVWHFVRQQVGWVALYRARFGERGDPDRKLDAWLDPAATYAAALYPLLVWHTQLPRKFFWFMAGDFVPGLPSFVAHVVRPVWLLLLVAFVARQVHLAATRKGVNLGKTIVVLTTFALWWLGIVAINQDWAFTVTNVLPHGIPYVVLIAAYSRKRYGDPDAPRAHVAMTMLRFGFVLAFGAIVGLALIEEGLWDWYVWHDHEAVFGEGQVLSPRALGWLVPLLALPQAVHYVLDGEIWKRAKNPQLARYL
jgi:hypothetical protein